jgi:hypothetical protein
MRNYSFILSLSILIVSILILFSFLNLLESKANKSNIITGNIIHEPFGFLKVDAILLYSLVIILILFLIMSKILKITLFRV